MALLLRRRNKFLLQLFFFLTKLSIELATMYQFIHCQRRDDQHLLCRNSNGNELDEFYRNFTTSSAQQCNYINSTCLFINNDYDSP
mmetsp:Transcript_11514/g.17498  ORF Transcript_11514/g.17498 Transcript_11514/m.17498 type:complete len:86 (+) Transcript_11514:179-436(+)